jgi:vancomycin permeability regulator SanA
MKWLKRIFFFGFCWFIIHSLVVMVVGLQNKPCVQDVAVVLGNKVNADGSLSPRLKARLDKSLALYQQQKVQFIITSGGIGKEGQPEGTVMKKYLILQGVPASKIIVDDYGNDTEASAVNSKRLCDSLGLHNITIVSQYFHLLRSNMLFKKQGFSNCCIASPSFFEWRDPYSLLREFAGYYIELVK